MLVAIGSDGDVFPFVGLGRALQRRGHVVHLASHSGYREVTEGAGLAFRELKQVSPLIGSAEVYHPLRAIERIAKDLILPSISPVYDLVTSLDRDQWIVIAHFFCYGARLAQERNGTPLVTALVNPFAIRSTEAMPAFPKLRIPPWAPRMVRRAFYSFASRHWDKQLAPMLNAFRKTLALPPVRDIFYGWALSPQRVIGLFPEWFAPKASDWPAAFVHGGFTVFDQGNGHPLPGPLLENNRPLVVFAAGSSGAASHAFFSGAVAASRGRDWQSILLTGRATDWDGDLPPNVLRYPFIPLSLLLPKSRVLVHHGGLGSASLALIAGVPQLAIPFGHDQFDTADRLERLGVGRVLHAERLETGLADAVTDLLHDRELCERAKQLALHLQSERSLDSLCTLIEAPLARSSPF